MNVLSLCDGMSCAQISLKEVGIKVDKYYASEIDKNAIAATQMNFPNTIQLGDVLKIDDYILSTLPKIDLVCFGSPCRSLSKATIAHDGYHDGLKGISGLFYDCTKILKWIQKNNNPDVWFLVENVDSDNKKDLGLMSDALGVLPILINSGNFSAQNRLRNYWTNLKVDIGALPVNGGNTQKKVLQNGRVRKLTPIEYMRLQGIPTWYKMPFADTHIYNMCGDGWNIPTINFFFQFIH